MLSSVLMQMHYLAYLVVSLFSQITIYEFLFSSRDEFWISIRSCIASIRLIIGYTSRMLLIQLPSNTCPFSNTGDVYARLLIRMAEMCFLVSQLLLGYDILRPILVFLYRSQYGTRNQFFFSTATTFQLYIEGSVLQSHQKVDSVAGFYASFRSNISITGQKLMSNLSFTAFLFSKGILLLT